MMVSVILPSYNHSLFLEQRINSILNQTYFDFELIILDDNSEDNSRDIIEKYRGNEHISHIIYNDQNSGSTFKQWQKGISLAKGEYIWIAESDDFSDLTFLQNSMEAIAESNATLTFSLSNIVNKDGTLKEKRQPLMNTNFLDPDTFIRQYLLYFNGIYNASSVVFKKSNVDNVDWLTISQMKYCGDWLFWSSILLNEESIGVNEVKKHLNNYRIHDVNVSNRSQKKGLDFFEGFIVSRQIAKKLGVNRDQCFIGTWVMLSREFIRKFNLSCSVQGRIWLTFIVLQPNVILYLFNKLKAKLIK